MWQNLLRHYTVFTETSEGFAPYYLAGIRHDMRQTTPYPDVLGYHWHPQERNAIAYPHLHLHHGAGTLQHNLADAHLPTARIAIEDVIRCVITQQGVVPLRDDWEAILAETQAAFQQWR